MFSFIRALLRHGALSTAVHGLFVRRRTCTSEKVPASSADTIASSCGWLKAAARPALRAGGRTAVTHGSVAWHVAVADASVEGGGEGVGCRIKRAVGSCSLGRLHSACV